MSRLVFGLMALRLLRVSGGNQEYTGTLQEDPGKCGTSHKYRGRPVLTWSVDMP